MNSIEVDNLSKSYLINHQTKKRAKSLRDLLSFSFNKPPLPIEETSSQVSQETFWALKDVTFSIAEGERVAIIGGNGAGKSTLLKILSRITEPTQGSIKIRGKVSSLLEVGTGFHPELTGRENIYLNGAILGMKRSEINAKFDQIVAFSGVEQFIDTPVKHYSSGMYVRLAFSVSAWLDPDILIVDEVLSVGDQAFQRRCTERMKELTSAGRTVLFVSHSMQAVKAMCEKALFLEKGMVRSFESVEEASNQYLYSIDPSLQKKWHKKTFDPAVDIVKQYGFTDQYLICLSATVLDHKDDSAFVLDIHKTNKIELVYEVINQLPFAIVPHFHFYDEYGERTFVTYPEQVAPQEIGKHSVICQLPPYVINTGRYSVNLIMSTFYGGQECTHHFSYESALRFEIVEQQGVDTRRHGWAGAVPGVTRPRLPWKYRSY